MRIAEAEGRETVTRVLKTDDFDVHETIKEMAWTSGAWRETEEEIPPHVPERLAMRRGRRERGKGRGGRTSLFWAGKPEYLTFVSRVRGHACGPGCWFDISRWHAREDLVCAGVVTKNKTGFTGQPLGNLHSNKQRALRAKFQRAGRKGSLITRARRPLDRLSTAYCGKQAGGHRSQFSALHATRRPQAHTQNRFKEGLAQKPNKKKKNRETPPPLWWHRWATCASPSTAKTEQVPVLTDPKKMEHAGKKIASRAARPTRARDFQTSQKPRIEKWLRGHERVRSRGQGPLRRRQAVLARRRLRARYQWTGESAHLDVRFGIRACTPFP